MSAATLLPRMPQQQAPIQMAPRKHLAKQVPERVVLTGFMGSGKSTVGALLAERLGWTFVDLDAEIEHRNGMTVSEIFAQFGEAHFRKLEASALAAVLGRRNAVIALGGGAPETLGNRLLLEQTPGTTVVLLHAPFDTLHDRCMHQGQAEGATIRPLLANRDQAETRYIARLRIYEQIATIRLDTTGSSAEEVSETVVRFLRRAI